MVSPILPSPLSSPIPHSKRTSGSSILMTITLEPSIRQTPAVGGGKEAIANPRSAPPPQYTTQTDQPLNPSPAKSTNLLQNFIEAYKEVESYRYVRRDRSCSWHVLIHRRSGNSILVDGYNLSIPAVAAAARSNAPVTLDESAGVRERLKQSRAVIVAKMDAGKSVYGVSTGYGGSGQCLPLTPHCPLRHATHPIVSSAADTRTDDPLRLGNALLQHQHIGVISTEHGHSLPLLDPLNSTTMPESWVRGAILIRMNSLIRGHSGVRMELIQQMNYLLREQITPLVPLRGSISASGGKHHQTASAIRTNLFRSQIYHRSRTSLGPWWGTPQSEQFADPLPPRLARSFPQTRHSLNTTSSQFLSRPRSTSES
jgi:hypothetical protein